MTGSMLGSMMGSIARVLAATALVLLAVPASAGGDPLAGLDAAIESARQQWQAPGLAVAIVKDDRVVYMKGFGTKQLGADAPVDVHTLFTLASTTKAFVGMSLGILVDEGKLAWDDPVIKYVPEFRVADPYVTREVTIRDLLVHRTGIEEMDVLWSRGFDTATDLKHMQYARQASSLRSTWAYNNAMYIVAAEVVARVSGMHFDEFVTKRIFAPLGMKDSVFTSPALKNHSNLAAGHLIVDGKAVPTDPYWSTSPLGAAGIRSSVSDMTKWLRMLLASGTFDGRQVVKASTVAEALKPQMLLAKPLYPAAELAQPHFYAYGLGWFLQDYRGRLLAMHTGSLYGANALVALMPEEKLGLVIFINAESVEYRHAFMYDVLDRFLDRHDRDWNAEVFKRYHDLYAKQAKDRAAALAARPANSPASLPLAAYAGLYNNPVAGDAEVTLTDGKLSLLMKPDAVLPLAHWSFDTFEAVDQRAPDERFFVTFIRGADGKIIGYDSGEGRKYLRR